MFIMFIMFITGGESDSFKIVCGERTFIEQHKSGKLNKISTMQTLQPVLCLVKDLKSHQIYNTIYFNRV